MTHDELVEIAKNSYKKGAREVHIVSAHNDKVGIDWYMEAFKRVRDELPDIHIKAMTGPELDFLSRQYGLSYDEVLDLMIENGLTLCLVEGLRFLMRILEIIYVKEKFHRKGGSIFIESGIKEEK